jgi:hypothetical protein
LARNAPDGIPQNVSLGRNARIGLQLNDHIADPHMRLKSQSSTPAYEAAPLRRAVRPSLPRCRTRAGSFRFAHRSVLRCPAPLRASGSASCPSRLGTGKASLAGSGHHIGMLPEAAMARLSAAAWDFIRYRPPGMGHITDDRLSARVDVDMLDHHLLPATSPHVRQRIHLGGEGAL